ncbi:kelch-like protein 24, partial [Branchiostoma lanceolatum]|uniref:kelch-like protein 24 n=1 Tax=Branchiostoma lanceolatum TaxID=7740 RepID=UPI0034516ABB
QTTQVSETVDDGLECDGSSWYPARFLECLQEFRSRGHLVDVTLCAEGKEIPCHRLVLFTYTAYFQAMFSGAHSESKKDKIEIGGVSAEALQLLVDFGYSAKVTITTDNVQTLYEAANMLQVKPVEGYCEDFLTGRLSPDTCLATWALADKVSNTYLSEMAKSFALKFFEDVCKTEDFLELPVDFLNTYISDNELHAKKEEQVIEAIMLWGGHDLEERETHLGELLECVRFTRVDKDYLKDIMESDKVLAGVPGIKELFNDQSLPARSCQLFQGEILILGGLTDRYQPNCDMYRLDVHCHRVDNAPLPQLPQSLRESEGIAACAVNNDVIVTGGKKSLSQAWRYSSSLNSWTKLGSLRTERYNHGMAVLQGKVYVVGGVRYGDRDRWLLPRPLLFTEGAEVYNELTDSWDEVAPLRQAVSSFGITIYCEKIYVLGGRTGRDEKTAAIQCYNPTLNSNEWTFETPLPKSLEGIKAFTINSRIYLVGGELEHVLCYDPQEDVYEEMAEPLFEWDLSSATACGSEIFFTGGWGNEDYPKLGRSRKSRCYNVNSDTMIRVQDIPIPLCRHISVTLTKL